MTGPALAVLMATTVSPRGHPLRGRRRHGRAPGSPSGCSTRRPGPPRSRPAGDPGAAAEWLTAGWSAVLAVSAAATLVLGGTDVAVVAVLRANGEVGWTGAVLAVWAVDSLVGGFAYGAVPGAVCSPLPWPPRWPCTIPVGLGGGQWWLLCLVLLPAGALCAPDPSPPPRTR